MTDAARIAGWIADDFYGRRLDFSERPASGGSWPELPEVNIVPKGLEDPRSVRLFLTFMAAVDKMVDAGRLWSAGAKLLRAHPGVFDPAEASTMDIEGLRGILQRGKVVKWPQPQARAWRKIAVSLSQGTGSVHQVVETGRGDARELLRDLRSHDSTGATRYPELRGPKIGPMWVRMMAWPGGAKIHRLEIVPVAVDVQVRRVTENLGIAATAALPLDKAKPRIQKAWFAAVAAASGTAGPERIRNTCAALDPALWFFGKHGCSHCEQEKRRIRFGRACQACRFPVPGPEELEKRTNLERRGIRKGLGGRFAEPFGTVAWHADGTPFTDEDYGRAGMDIPTPEQLKAAGQGSPEVGLVSLKSSQRRAPLMAHQLAAILARIGMECLEEAVMAVLVNAQPRKGLGPSEISRRAGIYRNHGYGDDKECYDSITDGTLARLVRAGRVVRLKKGRYAPTRSNGGKSLGG